MSRLIRHALLVLLLVIAQLGGIVHLTAHATQRLHDRPTTTTNDGTARCAQCVLYASLGTSPVPATITPAFVPTRPPLLPAAVAQSRTAQAAASYRSRAPPLQA
jgi:hypothetical protein